MWHLTDKIRRATKKLPVHPSFVLLFLWFVLTGGWLQFLIFVAVVLTHELGHYVVAKRLGYKLDSFFLAPYGVSLNYSQNIFERSDEIKIAIAGPLVNFFLALFCVALWWIVPQSYIFTDIFVMQSFSLGLFNLLPAYPMDGGRVLLSLLSKKMPRERALALIKIFNICFACLFFVLFAVSCATNFNPTFGLAGIFFVVGILNSNFESKYRLAALIKKQNKDFSNGFAMYVSADRQLGEVLKHIQQNRYTIFYVDFGKTTKVLDEKIVLRLAMTYSLNATLFEIYSNKK